MKKRTKQFQTIDVSYPKQLYVIWIWLNGENHLHMEIINDAFADFKDMCKAAIEIIDLLQRQTGAKKIRNEIGVMSLSFKKHYPLKKSYWQDPTFEMNFYDRVIDYLPAIEKPLFYEMLITPEKLTKKQKRIKFLAALPFLKGNYADVDLFLENTNFPVPTKAKQAAIYSIEEVFGYDLINNEKITKEPLNN